MDLKINSESWHWILYEEIYGAPEPGKRLSLCTYFWKVVAASFFFTIISLLYPFYVAYRKIKPHLPSIHVSRENSDFIAFAFFILAFGGVQIILSFTRVWWIIPSMFGSAGMIILITIGAFQLHGYLSGRRRKTQMKKQPNILIEYLRAKKRKVCPILEVVDSE